ncbi:MAG: hypothetical protein H8E55_57175 [Pelagibacterales bacterium]|nr:hypothetical protein [Pelagibacterales bacterium]
MKILRLLNKKNLSILISFFFLQNSYSTEPIDIWKIENQPNEKNNNEIIENENVLTESIFQIKSQEDNKIQVDEEKNLFSKNINIVGIYDPSENDLSMDMWTNSNGIKILELIDKIKNINLSQDAKEILNVSLLTNSYFPKKNISKEQFLIIKSEWLIKQQDLNLIETYLFKNNSLEEGSGLVRYYLDYYLSRSELGKACDIFNKINFEINDDYISKFKIYCFINSNKNEEAQLHFDLLKEYGFSDIFFEKKFAYLAGYDETISKEISEKSLLDFHLSHRTDLDFKFEPKINTPKLIWKYLSYSNLLENIDLIDLEDKEKLLAVEMATHEKNYKEDELFALYERFKFNINQLLTVEESYKLLPSSESRALVYQGILITKETSEKIKLIKLLKDLFIKDEVPEAFNYKLVEFLDGIDETEIPSDYTVFYNSYKKVSISKNKKIKFNNKIIHQSKILDHFKEESDLKNVEKDLENLLKKIKKDKKYFFSTKDIIMLESLKSDGIKIPKKYENIYEVKDPNIPYDIQILINKEESGLALLRLVQIIGEDKVIDVGPDTLYFIVSVLNQLNLDKIRNKILLKVLPLKV